MLGEESELLSDLHECLETFCEMDVNEQIIFPMSNPYPYTFYAYPVPYPLTLTSGAHVATPYRGNYTSDYTFEGLRI